jgi:hypothetical protein
VEETIEEQMAAKGATMLLNLVWGIVREGEFGIEVEDRVEVFNIEHCFRKRLILFEQRMFAAGVKLRCC